MLEDQYRCLYNLGWVSQRNGELAEAGTFADKSMDVAVKLKDKAMKVDAIILQATVCSVTKYSIIVLQNLKLTFILVIHLNFHLLKVVCPYRDSQL